MAAIGHLELQAPCHATNMNIKKTIIGLGIISTVALGATSIDIDSTELKADKSKIITSMTKTDNGITKYAYISEKKALKDDGEDIEKRTHNTKFFGNKARVYSGSQFYKDGEDWYEIEYATSTKEVYDDEMKPTIIEKLLGKDVSADTVYSNTYDTSVSNSGAVYLTVHDALIGSGVSSGATVNTYHRYFSGNGNYYINRTALSFDTSSVVGDISAVSLWVYPSTNTRATDSVCVVQHTIADITSIDNSDYDQFNDTSTACETQANLTTGSYHELAFDGTGVLWVDQDGYTKLGLRFEDDLTADAPTVNHLFSINSFDQTGTDKDPYLEITFGSADTCTYSGTGDWNVTMSDDCYITDDTYVDGDLILNGSGGSFTCASEISFENFQLNSNTITIDNDLCKWSSH